MSNEAVAGFFATQSRLILFAEVVVLCGDWRGNPTVEAEQRIAARTDVKVIDASTISPERLAHALLRDKTRIIDNRSSIPQKFIPLAPPSKNDSGRCWCGCGEHPKGAGFFVMGHDRRAEAGLVKLIYGNVAGFLNSHGFDSEKSTITRALADLKS